MRNGRNERTNAIRKKSSFVEVTIQNQVNHLKWPSCVQWLYLVKLSTLSHSTIEYRIFFVAALCVCMMCLCLNLLTSRGTVVMVLFECHHLTAMMNVVCIKIIISILVFLLNSDDPVVKPYQIMFRFVSFSFYCILFAISLILIVCDIYKTQSNSLDFLYRIVRRNINILGHIMKNCPFSTFNKAKNLYLPSLEYHFFYIRLTDQKNVIDISIVFFVWLNRNIKQTIVCLITVFCKYFHLPQ